MTDTDTLKAAAAALGRRGGSRSSPRKAEAARANARKPRPGRRKAAEARKLLAEQHD